MTIPEILKELELYTGRFPKAAMKAAVEQREAITPELLRVLESVAGDPAKWAERKEYMLHLFALFLLAQFREKRAYPLVVKIFGTPGESLYDLFGDIVADGLSQILGSVYDGDPAPLEELIEREEVYEFVRSSAIDAFSVLENTGQMPREQVVGYFQRLFSDRLKRSYSQAWNGLVCAVADLPAPELLEDVRRAYEEGLVDPGYADLPGIERGLRTRPQGRREHHHIITDAIAEMEGWSSFRQEEQRPTRVPEPPAPLVLPAAIPPETYVAPQPFHRQPKVGRNDPCPCGSGKKYKKCCGKG
jgi:hypothetical protein